HQPSLTLANESVSWVSTVARSAKVDHTTLPARNGSCQIRRRTFTIARSSRAAESAASLRSVTHALISALRHRLQILQAFRNQIGALPIIASVQNPRVVGIGAHINARRSRIDFRMSVGASCKVSGRAIGGLNSNLSSPVQLRRVRVSRPFSLPIVENTRR